MRAYLPGSQITFSVPLVDGEGMTVVAQSVQYRVMSEDGTELVAMTPVSPFVADPIPSAVDVTVSALHNTLESGAVREMRVIELYSTVTGAGTVLSMFPYLLESSEPLRVPDDAFVTLAEGDSLAHTLTGVEGYKLATKSAKVAALMQARLNMACLQYRYSFNDWQSIVEPGLVVSDLTLVDADAWANLTPQFKGALKRAEVLEANFLLGGDPDEVSRRSGLVLDKTGEAEQAWQPNRAITLPVCRRALQVLGKYIVWTKRISR